MRTFLTALVMLVVGYGLRAAEPSTPPQKPSAVGLWLGVMEVGPVRLRMALDIKTVGDEALSGKLLSLDQSGAEVPCESFLLKENKLTVQMPAISARYEGELASDGNAIIGEFIQMDNPVTLNLKRVEKLPTLNRPQHPTKPYPYREEDLVFANKVARIELAGTLTVPNGEGPFPAVVLVTGSGPQDRDQTLFEHKPFLVIADHLTRRGIAVLRFDDRGFGKSGGVFAGSTTEDFASDVRAAIVYLAMRKEIDARRLGIIGHSEGTIAAQLVAGKYPDEIACLVFLAGFGVSGEQLALDQSTDVVRSAGGSEKDIKLGGDLMKALLPIAKKSGTTEDIRAQLVAAAADFIAGLDDEKVRAALKGTENAVAGRLVDPWVRFFLNYDTVKMLGQIKCPVLALSGSRDVQVRSKENLRAIEHALRDGGNVKVKTVELQNLNHLFQTCTTGAISEYGSIEETFSPEALQIMSEWIKSQLNFEAPRSR